MALLLISISHDHPPRCTLQKDCSVLYFYPGGSDGYALNKYRLSDMRRKAWK